MIWIDTIFRYRRTSSVQLNTELEYFLLTESTPTVVSDLIVTSFDLLAVTIIRKDQSHVIASAKAFLTKRLPLAIKSLILSSQTNLTPDQVELAISQAFLSLNKDTLAIVQSHTNSGDNFDEMFSSSYSVPVGDIRFVLLRSLISLGIVRHSILTKIFNMDAKQANEIPINKVNEDALNNQGLIIDSSNHSFYF